MSKVLYVVGIAAIAIAFTLIMVYGVTYPPPKTPQVLAVNDVPHDGFKYGSNESESESKVVIQLTNDTYQVPHNWSGCFVNPLDIQDTSFGCPGTP